MSNSQKIDMKEAMSLRLRRSFNFRAQAVFFGRLCLVLLYCFLFLFSVADKTINFAHSWPEVFILLSALFYTLLCYSFRKRTIFAQWSHFITLVFDLGILIYFTGKSGYLLSPLMAIHPFITAVFLLLFNQPLMIIVPLLSIPLSTGLSLWGTLEPNFLNLMYAIMLLCILDALAIFFIYFVQSEEQRLIYSLIEMEKKLQRLAVEQERQRIAREFHDGIGAQLTSIVMQCDLLKMGIDQEEHKKRYQRDTKLCHRIDR